MKANEYWALYNASNLWAVEKTKRACRKVAEEATGEDWEQCKAYFKITKVTVSPLEH